jgi:murein DD-endopeptidase MepM/ murein hydrolase activator NlpD
MKHKFSLIVLGRSGSKIRQIHISRKQLYVYLISLLTACTAAVYGLMVYGSIRLDAADKATLESYLALQNEEVVMQRRQIQRFAHEINQLKERIMTLDQFEERIRLLASIDESETQTGLFGLGGSAPDDLDVDVDLHDSHQQLISGMHDQMRQLKDASQYQQSNFNALMHKLEKRKNMLAHTPAIRPAQGVVTSAFAYRQNPFTGEREFHRGMDIANHIGTPVVATADGVVSFMGESGPLGILVVIDHGYGLVTRYAHLKKGLKKPGERVRRGEPIGKMGNTGRSTGPHLHYEVRLNGVPVNPAKYFSE